MMKKNKHMNSTESKDLPSSSIKPKKHKTWPKIVWSVLATLLASLIVWVSVSLGTSNGVMNLVLRNAFAGSQNIGEPEWMGETYTGLQYAQDVEADTLDLYVPTSNKKTPLLIVVHGGGFIENDSNSRQATLMYQYFRSEVYSVASINYRLSPETTYPEPVSDVKAAIRYLRYNAEAYGFDTDKFTIFGESAGGYLATMAALSDDDEYTSVPFNGEASAGTISANVSSLIDFYGVLDFENYDSDFDELGTPHWLTSLVGTSDSTTRDNSIITKFLGKKLTSCAASELKEINPLSRLEGTTKNLDIYISHGSVDITVSKLQSMRFYDLAKYALPNNKVKYVEEKNFKHADDRFYTHENLASIKEFLED